MTARPVWRHVCRDAWPRFDRSIAIALAIGYDVLAGLCSIVVGVWIAKGTKLRERRERDFVIFAGFRGVRDPKAREVQERQATGVNPRRWLLGCCQRRRSLVYYGRVDNDGRSKES